MTIISWSKTWTWTRSGERHLLSEIDAKSSPGEEYHAELLALSGIGDSLHRRFLSQDEASGAGVPSEGVIEVFADTSGFYALIVCRDENHARAHHLFRRAARGAWRLVTTNAVIFENHALLLARARRWQARILGP